MENNEEQVVETNEILTLDDIYFKDAFTKTEDKLNLEVNNAKVDCLMSKNNKFSLDEEGNFTANSVNSNDLYFKDAFSKTENKINLDVNNINIDCLTSKNNKFSLDVEGNLTVNSINVSNPNSNNNLSLLDVYPIGSLYMSVNATNPSEYFGGTWVSWGAGRVPVGIDTAQAEFNAIEKTGGEKNHVLSVNEMPAHSHGLTGNGAHTHTYTGFIQCATASNQNYTAIAHKRYNADGTSTPASMNSSGGHSHSISNNGGSGAHNNLQPYITCYMWKRTA